MRYRLMFVSVVLIPLITMAIVFAGGAAPAAPQPGGKAAFADARLIIEYNATDGDIGMQVFLDGESWKRVDLFNPAGRKILEVKPSRSLALQGMTELFFESSEPPLADVPLPVFLARFPAGRYEFDGLTIDGREIEGTAIFTHAIPAAPVILTPPNGSTQNVNSTVVSWRPVPNPSGSRISAYQVIVEDEASPAPKKHFSVHVPANVTRVTVPPEFLRRGNDYKFEVLAIETGGNQTITEAEFRTKR